MTTRRMSSSLITTRSERMPEASRPILMPVCAMNTAIDQPANRIELRVAQPHAGERHDDRARRQHVAARVRRIGQQQLAVQRPPALRFVAHDQQVDAERDQHDHEAGRRDVGHVAGAQPAERALQDLDHHQEQEHEDAGGGERLVLAMAVGVVFVRRLARRAHGDDGHDVRRAVGQRVKAVRNDADRAGRVAERQLGDRRPRG